MASEFPTFLQAGAERGRIVDCGLSIVDCGLRIPARMPELTYLEAISSGLREEMVRNQHVVLMGEDIGTYGGAFRVTKGFLDKFKEIFG